VRTLLEKLGISSGVRVALLGVTAEDFRASLREAGVETVDEDVPPGTPVVLLQAKRPEDLAVLSDVRERVARDGAVWVLWPRGGAAGFGQREVMDAGLAAGLVDVKVASFSDRLSALKFVIRVADR
jgi:hypothetical protein